MKIYCAACKKEADARLTNGTEIYPHRPDLSTLPFWKCDTCGNYVGCHYKTKDRTRPLGCIATPDLKNARKHIHKLLDPLWRSKKFKRRELYAAISNYAGHEYHTAEIKSVEEARKIYAFIREFTRGDTAI